MRSLDISRYKKICASKISVTAFSVVKLAALIFTLAEDLVRIATTRKANAMGTLGTVRCFESAKNGSGSACGVLLSEYSEDLCHRC